MRVSIALVQISSDFTAHTYLPYSVGVLRAYLESHIPDGIELHFTPFVVDRDNFADSVSASRDADIMAVSTYLWNEKLSLELAARFKRLNPAGIVVFGGPQVPRKASGYLSENPFIDICARGEGEMVLLEIVRNFSSRDWSSVPNITFRSNEQFIETPDAPRIKALSTLPSPYLTGVFDDLLASSPERRWIATWETNRGCPFSCTFCDFGSATAAKVHLRDITELKREIEWFARNKIEYLFCADANFGMLPRDLELARYLSEVRLRTGYPHSISIESSKSVTPLSLEIQQILNDCGLNRGTVLSMQTVHAPTLKAIKRTNIPLSVYFKSQSWCAARKIPTMTDLIIGLPLESYSSFLDGVSMLIENGQHNRIQFNNLCILPNAELADKAYRASYEMRTVSIPVVNQHGKVRRDDIAPESQEMVVSTSTMSVSQWQATRVFCWLTSLLHFDKLAQMPLILVNHLTKLSFREIIEFFTKREFLEGVEDSFPVLRSIMDRLEDHAVRMCSGNSEYIALPDRLGIWWPIDEAIFFELYLSRSIESFYSEFERAVLKLLSLRGKSLEPTLLRQCIDLNFFALKLPSLPDPRAITLDWNILEFYQGVLVGKEIQLSKGETVYTVDDSEPQWDSSDGWLREVIWYQNKTGGYLRQLTRVVQSCENND